MLRYCLAILICFSVCEAELQDTNIVKAVIEVSPIFLFTGNFLIILLCSRAVVDDV